MGLKLSVGGIALVLGSALGSGACGSSDESDADAGDSGVVRDGGDASATEDAETQDASSADAGRCVPSASEFETNALPVIERRCASCHAEEPQFGAPFSLLEYAPLVEEGRTGRIVDRMVDALATGFMPPRNSPQLTPAEQEALLSWASCGQAGIDR